VKSIWKNTVKTFCLSLALMPALVLAQTRPVFNGGGAGGGVGAGGGMGAGGGVQPMLQVIKELDLTGDQKQNIAEIMKQARQDASDATAGIQDATPQERVQKMQDVQKIINDAKEKAEGVLTPDQKAKYYPLAAKALVSQFTDRVKAMQAASDKMDLADDKKAKLKAIYDDDFKTLDGCKTDAAAVTDAQGLRDLEQKVNKVQLDTRRQLVGILGPDDLKTMMQNMRPAGGAAGRSAATTKPAGQ
jgi:Spy/CpxP family protein refolding chaperone